MRSIKKYRRLSAKIPSKTFPNNLDNNFIKTEDLSKSSSPTTNERIEIQDTYDDNSNNGKKKIRMKRVKKKKSRNSNSSSNSSSYHKSPKKLRQTGKKPIDNVAYYSWRQAHEHTGWQWWLDAKKQG